jgi:capsular polysaccharide export protein
MRNRGKPAAAFPFRASPATGTVFDRLPDLAADRHAGGAVPIVAWPGRGDAVRLKARAAAAGVPFVAIGPGLLRAPPRGRMTPAWLSAVAGDIAGPPSPADRLSPERVLAAGGWEPVLLAEAAAARRELCAARIGGAWWGSGGAGTLPAADNLAVVVLADRDPGALQRLSAAAVMLDAALAEHPAQRVVVIAGPVAGGGLRRPLASAAARGATVIEAPCDPWTLIERAARVYCAGGETGFLALCAGVPVTAFGDAFYTGWGATDDRPGVRQHPSRRGIDEIFAAYCLVATRYRDPFHDAPSSFADTLVLLAEWRRLDEANRRIAVCVGMSFWKRRRIAEFLCSSRGVPAFRRSARAALAVVAGGAIAGWASRLPAGLADEAARRGIPLLRVEDGFIRSIGLGSDFLPPASLVVDSRGMYFDPAVRSDLEILLHDSEFPPNLVARAERLAAKLVARGITKYNLAGRDAAIDLPRGRRAILVPGQVEDDLSILRGGGAVRTNLALLEAVRAANPDAYVIYKPHPDVLAGHRTGAVSDAAARHFADAVLPDAATAALLDRVDEVHTMTSLAGFEALLRGRRVVVYGRPFYAGWGLTEDREAIERGRRLSLYELVAGALILYPRYLDPLTRLPCGPELVIERLDRPDLWRPGLLVAVRRLQGAAARRLARLLAPTEGAAPRAVRERPRG